MIDALFKLYERFIIPENIWLYEDPEGGFGSICQDDRTKKWIIMINRIDPFNEQLLTIMHESLHFHPEFEEYSKSVLNSGIINPETEDEITNLAREVMKTRPDIMSYVRSKFKEVLELDKERPF